jgi:DNA end-binding protein Ku
MPRAIWSGAITFGLVNVPVRMYSAVQEHDIRFHLVHEKDGSRIGYQKVSKEEGKEVPDDEVVKAFETDDGELVYMSDEDFEAAQIEGYRSIDIEDFVPSEEIDPIFFDHTYYLGPADGAEHVYTLLAEAMEKSGLAAICKYVMRERQHLGCLRIRERTITLEKMHFADEIRPVNEIRPKKAKVDRRELAMAAELIDRFTGHFDPKAYKDTYRDALLKVIEQKRKGKEVHVPKPRAEDAPTDLVAALEESLAAAKKRGRRPAPKSRSQNPAAKRRTRAKKAA